MDTLLGAQFFELVCLVLLERSVLTEQMDQNEGRYIEEEEVIDMKEEELNEESEGL
jgi:hypothetical protein